MSKDNIVNNTNIGLNERSTKSGFIELDGFEGCANWEEIDMQDPKYDEHTRFIKTLRHFVRWGLSDWYSNAGVFNNDNIFRIIPKMAPYATKLYNSYSYNLEEYARFDKHTIEYIAQNKRFYIEDVFSSKEANEYDKMVAASIVLHEFIMWSENDEYYTQCVNAIKGYYIDFFQKNRHHLVDSVDLEKWDALVKQTM